MARKKTSRPSGIKRVSMLPDVLADKLENPGAVVDLLVTALAKGEQHPELWEKLHEAASRDGVAAELAAAYELVAQERRIKLLAPEDRAHLFLCAAQLFGDVLGDWDAAIAHGRRILQAVPGHAAGLATLERLLVAKGDVGGLAQLYAEAAANEPSRERRLELLRMAASQVEDAADADRVAVTIYRRLVSLVPEDGATVEKLVSRLVGAGRQREAAKALEDALRQADADEAGDTTALRSRLLDLYATEFGEPHRAIAHVEALLAAKPDHDVALGVAESLLEHRVAAPRAAAALSDAYEKVGRLHNAADMLTLELKLTRGPRRVEVQRRLAILRQDVLGDTAGALELLGPAVAGDPSDDDLRRRFVELSVSLNQPLEAARLLERALRSARDPSARARVGVEVGGLYRRLGDVKRAEEALRKVIAAGQDDSAVLGAAKQLSEMYAEAGDQKQLAAMLELVVRFEPESEPRHQAARKLTRLCDEGVADEALAIPAWEALADSPWADEALRRLEPLHEAGGNHAALASVLERRALRAKDRTAAQALAFRAAELRSTLVRDRGAALEAWRKVVATYGPSREAHARLLPLLEQEKQWDEAAALIEQEITLAPADEHAKLWSRLAQLRLSRLGDPKAALEALRRALEVDPAEAASRAAVEKLLGAGDVRLEAADILEPLYRNESSATGLLRVLQTRGELAARVEDRLTALGEAVDLAEQQLQDVQLAVTVAGRALAIGVTEHQEAVAEWLDRVQALATSGVHPETRAHVLTAALGDQVVASEDLLNLARAAGEALALCGEIQWAIDVYRRALDYAPSSPELLSRVDELLAQQGSPDERLALYQAALEQPCDVARRRELIHAMAALQCRELQDLGGATETWQRALTDDPRDHTAHQALVEVLTQQERWNEVYAELQRAVVLQAGERRMATLRRMAEVKQAQGEPQPALAHYRELLAEGRQSDEVLASVEQLAQACNDAETTRDVLEQRIANATDPDEQAELWERLGRVQALELGDAEAAAASWREGARLSDGVAENEERALRLYERVLHVSPTDTEAAERLIELYAQTSEYSRIPDAFEVVLSGAADVREVIAQLLGLEAGALVAGAADVFVKLIDHVQARGDLDPDRARQLRFAKARGFGAQAATQQAAADSYRELLEQGGSDQTAVADAFESFLKATELTPSRIEDWRWLLRWRADRAEDAVPVLMRWALAEERQFQDPPAALALYERVVAADADRTDAMTEVARLRAQLGDPEGALQALEAVREQMAEPERPAVDLKIAALLLDHMDRPGDALDVVQSLLEQNPSDPEALGIVNRTLGHGDTKARASELLERTAAAAEDATQRARVLETLLAMSADAPELAEARRRWYLRLAEANEDDPETGLPTALRGAAEYPDEEELWEAAERFARRLDEPGPVAEAYSQVLEAELPAETAEALGRRMVEFHEEWFEDPDRVIALLRRVITLSPTAGWAFDRLKLAYNAAGRWEDLFGLYDQALARAEDGKERADLLREAAMAAKDFAADPDRAISYLEQYNQCLPGDSRIESSLERLYEREGRVRPLILLLSGQLEKAEGRDRLDLQARVASLYLDIDAPGSALMLLEAALEIDPESPDVTDLLERILTLPSAREALADAAEPGEVDKLSVYDRAADHLRVRYEQAGQTAEVARVMEARLESVTGFKERVARLEEIVALRLQKLDDAAGAFENVSALVRLQPDLEKHREQLAELAERIAAQARRAELLTTVAQAAPSTLLRARLEQEAAGVYRQNLAQPARAIELFLHVLATAADEPDLGLGAARELDILLHEAGRDEERCTVLEQRAELETDPDARREALGDAARVAADRLGDLERAIRAWRLRLQDDARDHEALDGLCENLERAGQYLDLIEVLGSRARLSDEPERAKADRIRIARIQAEQLDSRPAAIEAWHEVRKHHGRDLVSFEALAELLQAEKRWDALATLLSEEAAAETEERRRVSLYRSLGDLHRARTGDAESALNAYVSAGDWELARAVAGADGLAAEVALRVRERLLELAIEAWQAERGGDRAVAAADWAVDALADKLREVGSHDHVVALLLRAAEHPFSVARKRQLQKTAACTCSDQLEEDARAIEIFRGLYAEDPSDAVALESVTRFALLLQEAGEFSELVALWEGQAQLRADAGDTPTAAALWARSAELCERELKDEVRAIEDYRNGAGLGGEAALEALERIYQARGELPRVVEVLEWLCAQSSRDALGQRALRLADAYVALGQPAQAQARLEQAAANALEPGPVRRRLAELYRNARDFTRLADLLVTESGRAPNAKTRLTLLREAASLHRVERGDPASAVALLEQAVELEPDDASLRLDLSDALTASGRCGAAAEILEDQIKRYGARRPKDRALVHFHLAKVYLADNKQREALAELTSANTIDPAHPEILKGLANLALEQGQVQRAERMLRALLLVLKPGDEAETASRSEALLDLSQIAVLRDDPVQATEFIESAFEAALESEHEAYALEAALRARGRTELLARALEARLEHAREPHEAARALADLVMMHAAGMAAGGPPPQEWHKRAKKIQRQLEGQASSDDAAWEALGQVYDHLGDEAAETAVLERRVAGWVQRDDVPPDAAPFYRLAEVRLANAQTRDEALSLLERAHSIAPDPEREERLLRTLLDADPTNEAALRLLEEIAREPGREPALAEVLTLIARLPGVRPETIREGVELGKRLEDLELVERMLLLGLEAQLPEEDAVWARVELAALREANGQLVEALELREQAAGVAGPEEARALLLSIAAAAAGPADDLARAARIYEQLLEDDPADQAVWEPLLDVHRRRGDNQGLVRIIEQTVTLVDSVSGRNRLRLEQANILLDQAETDQAADILREILQEDPTQDRAAQLLSGILEQEGRDDELAALLTSQLDAAKDRQDLDAIRVLSDRLIQLLEKARRVDDALDVAHAVLDWDAQSEPARRTILRLAEAKDDSYQIGDALEGLLGLVSGSEAANIAARLIGLRREMDDPAGVERAVELGFSACPHDQGLREGLIALRVKREDWSGVAEVLEQALERDPTDQELIAQLMNAYRSAGDPERALEVLAGVIEREPENAARYHERAALLSELGRDEEALQDLERAHAATGQYAAELTEALEKAVARAEDAAAERQLTLRLIDLLCDSDNVDGARARLRYLVDSDPNDRASLKRLAELEAQAEQWDNAAAAYVQLMPLEEGEALLALAGPLTDACQRAGRPEDARVGLERTLAVAPDNAEVRAKLRVLYEVTGEHRELARLLQQEAASQTDMELVVQNLLRAGELLLAPGGDDQEAMRVLEEVRTLAPDNLYAVVLLARACSLRGGGGQDAMSLLEATIAEYQGRRVRELGLVYQEISRMQYEEGFLTDAMLSLSKGFELDLRNAVLGMQLGELALDIEEWEAAAKAFRHVSMMKSFDAEKNEGATVEQKADAQYYLGWLAKRSGDLRKAKILVSKALAAVPDHEQARALLEELNR